jgi:hypothetical protein
MNAFLAATIERKGNHGRSKFRIAAQVHQHHSRQFQGLRTFALENRVTHQAGTVTGGQNPNSFLFEGAAEVPRQSIFSAGRQKSRGLAFLQLRPEAVEPFIETRGPFKPAGSAETETVPADAVCQQQ